GATVNFTVTASDNCSSPVILTYSKNSGTVFSTGTTTVTVTAKDVSGNTSTKSFTVTVTDTQKPSVTAPSNITTTVSSSGSKATVNLGTPVTSDNCGVKTISNNRPSSYPVGTTTVTWTVMDVNGNSTTATQTVTVTAVRKKTNATTPVVEGVAEDAADGLKIIVAPNPSPNYFTLRLESKSDAPIGLRIIDAGGRLVDAKSKLAVGSILQVGQGYTPGIYFAECTQGSQRKVIQLIKIK
ncbi:MAG: HYR domain-containing protein, partial [Sediminibacterium sp.]